MDLECLKKWLVTVFLLVVFLVLPLIVIIGGLINSWSADAITNVLDVLISWPLAILLIAMIFHHPLSDLMRQAVGLLLRVEAIEWNGIRLEMAKIKQKYGDSAEVDQAIVEIAKSSPRGAILAAWRDITFAANDALIRYKLEVPTRFRGLALRLKKAGIIDDEHHKLLTFLRSVQRSAKKASAESFATPGVAKEFAGLAAKMIDYLKSREPETGPLGPEVGRSS